MILVPAFRKNFKATLLSRDRALLVSEGERLVVDGRHAGTVAARINGRLASSEIVNSLGAGGERFELLHTLLQFEEKGLLMEAESGLPAGEAQFWVRLGVAPREAHEKLGAGAVDVIALDGESAEEEMAAALARAGIPRRAGAPLAVVIAEDYLDARLRRLNREFRALGRSWMLVKPVGAERIGPLFHEQTACWECLAARIHEDQEPLRGAIGPTCAAILNLAAAEVAKWLVLGKSDLENSIARVDLFTLEITRHRVARLPHCPACGAALRFDPSDLERGAVERANFEEHVDPLTGIVAVIRRREAPHDFFPVYFAPQALPRFSHPVEAFAVGKGETDSEARISCLAEAIERYCCAADGSELLVRSRGEDLDAPSLTRRDLGIAGDDGVIDWTPVWSLTRARRIWIPADYCFLDRANSDSNGCAAGHTLEDAILRGFRELVERDSLALWWYNRAERPEIRSEFGGALGERLRENFRSIGRTLHLLDLTADLEIPVVAAISARVNGSAVAFGFGADFDVAAAARHALLELQQMVGAIDDPSPVVSPPLDRWLQTINLERESWLRPSGAAAGAHASLPAMIGACRDAMDRHHLELLVANLTRPGVDVPVARVIVPGLCSMRPRFAHRRLQEIPVKLGWIDRARAECEMNPIPFFL